MNNDDGKQPTIIIRRIKKIKKTAHHGGSWKIAYADFVTAMMAFFLLMWLLSLLNKYQREGIAEYFKAPFKQGYVYGIKDKNLDKNSQKNKEKEKEKEKTRGIEKGTQLTIQKNQIQKMNKSEMLKQHLEKSLEKNPQLRQFKNQLNFIVTANGLKIQLKDIENKAMFSTGKADFETYTKPILKWLGAELNTYPNQVVIIGHTDTAKFSNNNYTNWELSADRANATRRALIKAGMTSEKITRIIGKGDRELLNKNGLDPSNRRIEIIVLSDEALNKEKIPATPSKPLFFLPNAGGTTPH